MAAASISLHGGEMVALTATAAIGAFAYRVTGFGAALIFMTAWHVLNGFEVLHVAKSLIAVQQCVTAMECFLSILLFRQYYSQMDLRFAAFVAVCAALGGALGTVALLFLSGNPWFMRAIGVCMVACYAIQAVVRRSSQTRTYTKRGIAPMVANAAAFTSGGLFGGFLGTPGPPLIVYTLMLNVERDEVIMYNAAHYVGFNWCKAFAFVAARDVERSMVPVILVVILGAFAGLSAGNVATAHVSQETFVDVLQGLLLCFAAMSMAVQTSFEVYARVLGVVLLPIYVAIRVVLRRRRRHAEKMRGGTPQLPRRALVEGTGSVEDDDVEEAGETDSLLGRRRRDSKYGEHGESD